MGASYRNIVDADQLKDAIGSGDFSGVIKKPKREAKYIKGYIQESGLEALAKGLNINKGLFKQVLGLEDKQLDGYDPYHLNDSKREEFWYTQNASGANSTETKMDGKQVQNLYDEDTNTFKRALYTEYGYRDQDFYYEDPFIPSFELFFDTDSPFFKEWNVSAIASNTPSQATFEDDITTTVGNSTTTQETPLQVTDSKQNTGSLIPSNSFLSFIDKYSVIDPDGYKGRYDLWVEFCNVFFKIFEKEVSDSSRNRHNKPYYITKIDGLQNLNKKMIKFGPPDGDKITITLNEDVSMIAWYIAELYNNIVYSYRNQRYAFPENVLRFDMTIKINDMRMFTLPQNSSRSGPTMPSDKNSLDGQIRNMISDKSEIFYTLHDCNFDFFQSKNYGEGLEIGGYGMGVPNTPQSLSFDIYFKSVTRKSHFPLQSPLDPKRMSINGWEKNLSDKQTISNVYSEDINRIKQIPPTSKGFMNQLLTKGISNVANVGINYLDNLETKLREVRGGVVNDALRQFRNATNINKIEPDNVYNKDFNNRISLRNFGKQVASSILNDLEDTTRNTMNF